jgi:hypothetical protein
MCEFEPGAGRVDIMLAVAAPLRRLMRRSVDALPLASVARTGGVPMPRSVSTARMRIGPAAAGRASAATPVLTMRLVDEGPKGMARRSRMRR